MKFAILAVLMSVSTSSFCQEKQSREHYLEYSVLPLLYYSYAHIGYSNRQGRNENSVLLSSYHTFLFPTFDYNISYSYNRFLKDSDYYIPYWFRVANTRHKVGFEEGYHPHTLRFSIGSGIGLNKFLRRKCGVRIEAGLGFSLNLTSTEGRGMYYLERDYSSYSFDQKYPDQNPPVILAFRLKIGFNHKLNGQRQ